MECRCGKGKSKKQQTNQQTTNGNLEPELGTNVSVDSYQSHAPGEVTLLSLALTFVVSSSVKWGRNGMMYTDHVAQQGLGKCPSPLPSPSLALPNPVVGIALQGQLHGVTTCVWSLKALHWEEPWVWFNSLLLLSKFLICLNKELLLSFCTRSVNYAAGFACCDTIHGRICICLPSRQGQSRFPDAWRQQLRNLTAGCLWLQLSQCHFYPSSQSSWHRAPWVSCSTCNYSSDLTPLLFSIQVFKVVLCKVLEVKQLPAFLLMTFKGMSMFGG